MAGNHKSVRIVARRKSRNLGFWLSFWSLLGRGAKKTCRCRHVKKICQWHIFSVDLSGYAAVASILVCTAPSFSLRSRRLYPVAVPKISLRHLSRRNFDRCHSFAVLYLPPAAHGSLPAVASILNLKALSYVVRAERVIGPYSQSLKTLYGPM